MDYGIAGFLDHIQKPNFLSFAELTETLTGRRVIQTEHIIDDGTMKPLNAVIDGVDTVVVISFDSSRTDRAATSTEIQATGKFLDDRGRLIFVCPHHDIGEATGLAGQAHAERRLGE